VNKSTEAYVSDEISISKILNVKFLYQFHSEEKYNVELNQSVQTVNKTVNTSLKASKNLNLSNIVAKNVSVLNDRTILTLT